MIIEEMKFLMDICKITRLPDSNNVEITDGTASWQTRDVGKLDVPTTPTHRNRSGEGGVIPGRVKK